jgi:hypothetical protein
VFTPINWGNPTYQKMGLTGWLRNPEEHKAVVPALSTVSGFLFFLIIVGFCLAPHDSIEEFIKRPFKELCALPSIDSRGGPESGKVKD